MSKLYNELVRQQREAQIHDSELSDIPVMMTVPELGKLLRISRNKAYEYVRSGAVPSIKVGRSAFIEAMYFLCADSGIHSRTGELLPFATFCAEM